MSAGAPVVVLMRHTTEVDNCSDNASILAACEHGLQEDDLAEDGLSIKPEEDPYVKGRGVIYDVDHEDTPSESGHHSVDDCVEDEP